MAKPKIEKKPQVNIQKMIREYWEILEDSGAQIPPPHMHDRLLREHRKGNAA